MGHETAYIPRSVEWIEDLAWRIQKKGMQSPHDPIAEVEDFVKGESEDRGIDEGE